MYIFPRIIFAGTPNFASHHLNTIIKNNYNIISVITKPDNVHYEYKKKEKFNSIKQTAILNKIKIFQPNSLNDLKEQKYISKLNPDIIIVVAYGLIIPSTILNIPKLGCINVHCSLLPRWRGAAPIQRAIISGDKITGITIIQMDTGLDTGEILFQKTCLIKSNDNTLSLENKLSYYGSNGLLNILKQIIFKKKIKKIKQNNKKIKYAKKINKIESKLNWNLSAIQLERYIRAFNPWPISYFLLNKEIVIKVHEANLNDIYIKKIKPGTIIKTEPSGINVATGNGVLKLTKLQFPGKKIMSVNEIINSKKKFFSPGTILY